MRLPSIQLALLLQKLRKLQVEVTLFNQVFASIVFLTKILAIGVVILCGFGAIQFSHENPFLAVINFVFALDAMMVFNLLYDRGFTIPRQFSILKRLTLLKLKLKVIQGATGTESLVSVEKGVKSVRVMAIQVGAFHHLQRLSTPLFLDFCGKNLVRLVMRFRNLK